MERINAAGGAEKDAEECVQLERQKSERYHIRGKDIHIFTSGVQSQTSLAI
uniref:Uncharacterized protein n=1 Tax=Anguilla anguilla TaxID=7936 RepID=A0A0E9R7Q9_ANGAN